MSATNVFTNRLFKLYERYVGEADSRTDVYGYWTFIAGYLIATFGVLVYLVGPGSSPGPQYVMREISISISAFGLAVGLFGIVLLLPVRRRGVHAALVGFLVSVVGVAWFLTVYPNNWQVGNDQSPEVMDVYATGLAILAGVTALVPVLTGQRGLLVEEEGIREDPPIMLGETEEDAMFAVHHDADGNWTWNVVHERAMAASEASSPTRPDAEAAIESVKEKIGGARLLEITTAAFRLYETAEDTWHWMLMREDGSVVSESEERFDDRDDTERSVSFLKDRAPTADVVDIDGASFSYHEDDDGWHWELLDEKRRPLASEAAVSKSKSEAESAAETAANHVEEARTLVVETFGVELFENDDGWLWRFLDPDNEELLRSTDAFDSRRGAEADVEGILEKFDAASRTVTGEPTYELYEEDGTWKWRLIDGTERLVARNMHDHEDHDSAAATAKHLASEAERADIVEIDDAAYETYPRGSPDDEEGQTWHWRLVTEDRTVVADSTEPHESPEEASDAIERVRSQAAEADLIEFEEAAFQVYEDDTGQWRWRLIDEDGGVMADSGTEHDSKSDAAEAMMTLKKKAPDADIIEIDTAAFELFSTDDGEWGWRLIDEGGKLIAEAPRLHSSRSGARDAMNQLTDNLEAEIRTMETAAFQTFTDGDDWHWHFVLTDGRVVARSTLSHPTRDDLLESLDDLKPIAGAATQYTVGDLTIQLHRNGEWGFRLQDRDREVLAESTRTYGTRDEASDMTRRLQRNAADAPVFTIQDAAVWVSRDDAGWSWELVTADRDVLAVGPRGKRSAAEVEDDVERVKLYAPDAGTVDFDVASFEVFPEYTEDDQEEWRWRLLDENRDVVTQSATSYDDERSARDAIDDVRDLIGGASILEIDSAAFELHAEDGGWRWQLVDDDGDAMATSTQVYDTRVEAREAMTVVKDHAPDGWINFAEQRLF